MSVVVGVRVARMIVIRKHIANRRQTAGQAPAARTQQYFAGILLALDAFFSIMHIDIFRPQYRYIYIYFELLP